AASAPSRPEDDRLGDVGRDRVAAGLSAFAELGEGELSVFAAGGTGGYDAGGAGRHGVGDRDEVDVQQQPFAVPFVFVVGHEGDVAAVAEGAEARVGGSARGPRAAG